MEEWQPQIKKTELEPGVDICLLELSEPVAEILRYRYISELNELEKTISYKHRISEILATYYLIDDYTGGNSKIMYEPGGKPYLSDAKYEISVSHTRNLVGVAFSSAGKIGIDIEFFSDRVNRISSRFLSQQELENTRHEQSTPHRMVYWTMKESMLKLCGDRHLDFRNNLIIGDFEFSEKGRTKARIQDAENQINCLNTYFIEGELVVTWSMYLNC